MFLEHITAGEAMEWKRHLGAQFNGFPCHLKIDSTLFIDGILEDLLTECGKEIGKFQFVLSQYCPKAVKKKPSPQIETYPHTQNNAIHFTCLCTEMEIHFS